MPEQFVNNASTTLAAAIIGTDTSLTVADASAFPASGRFRVLIEDELVMVTAGAGTTSWTVTRAIEGTTAAAHASGATVTAVLTAAGLITASGARQYFSLPYGWDDCWRKALVASAGSPATAAFWGDSFMQGYIASNWLTKGYVGLLRSTLQTKYGRYATFYAVTESQVSVTALGGANGPYTFGGTPPWTIAGSPSWSGHGYTKGVFYPVPASTMPLVTFISPDACTQIDVIYYDYVSGSWDYKVDGGAAVTLTTLGDGITKRLRLTGLANTTHTLTFGNTVGANNLVLGGCACYSGASGGVGVSRLAYAGSASDIGSAARTSASVSTNIDRALFFQGKYSGGDTGIGFPMQTHLFVIGMGNNDAALNTGVANYQQYLARVIQAARRGQPNCSILFALQAFPDASSDNPQTINAATQNYPQYVAAAAQVAAAYNCGFIHFGNKWSGQSVALGFTGSGNQHPIDAGHQDMADTLAAVIL